MAKVKVIRKGKNGEVIAGEVDLPGLVSADKLRRRLRKKPDETPEDAFRAIEGKDDKGGDMEPC